jgi:hypothetical protein
LRPTLMSRWLRGSSTNRLAAVGIFWVILTLAFEVGVGRFVLGYSWDRLASDYNLREGGLLPIGLGVMALSPMLAVRLRRAI